MSVRRHVLRLLAGKRKDTGERLYPEFVSFEGGERPIWWSDDIVSAQFGAVLGVHEKQPHRRAGSVVVAEQGLALLSDKEATWVRYNDVEHWDKLSKELPSQPLRVWTRFGQLVELPFNDDGAFTFVRFLSRAIWENEKK